MNGFKKAFAVLTALILLLSACACKGKKQDEKVEDQLVSLTDAQKERIDRLAKAFYRFGPCSMNDGISLSKVEYMIYCYYTDSIEQADVEGYGRLPQEEADKTVEAIFSGLSIEAIIRTGYDINKQQDYYLLNGYYYVKISDEGIGAELESYENLIGEDGAVKGIIANVRIVKGTNMLSRIRLELPFSDTDEFWASECTVQSNY